MRWLAVGLGLGLALGLALAGCGTASSGTAPDAPAVAVGPAFVDLNGDTQHPLDTRGVRASVLVFITTDCPISNGYAPELRAIVAEHAGDPLRFFFVHVDSDVDRAAAAAHAREYRLVGSILLDPDHVLVRRCGATVTPEVAIVTAGGRLAYRGRIDNWYGDLGRKRPRPTRHDLRDAIRAVLAGEAPATARTEAIGCFIPD